MKNIGAGSGADGIDMPEMDGIETAKRIMEMTDHTVPILFVTALCDRQTVTLCRNLDAAGYIGKTVQAGLCQDRD